MGRGFGPKKQGPDLSWADDDIADPSTTRATSPPSNIPAPLFPPRTNHHQIRTPVPLTDQERCAVECQLSYRNQCRESPLFTVYDTSLRLVDYSKNVRAETLKKRAFDPFAGQDRWTQRVAKTHRTVPDLSVRREYGFTLSMFPEELWAVMDPQMAQEEWKTLRDDSPAWPKRSGKRKKEKRKKRVLDDMEDDEKEESDEDVVRTNRKRRKKEAKAIGQKKGLDAEDEFEREDDGDADEDEAEMEDSELEEDTDDEAENDYNAENYFSAGDDDDLGDGEAGMDDY